MPTPAPANIPASDAEAYPRVQSACCSAVQPWSGAHGGVELGAGADGTGLEATGGGQWAPDWAG